MIKIIISQSNGHKIYYDRFNEAWRYLDDHKDIEHETRSCIKCNQYQNKDGHDYCISNLPNVSHACCGHGLDDGYVLTNDRKSKKFKQCDNMKKLMLEWINKNT